MSTLVGNLDLKVKRRSTEGGTVITRREFTKVAGLVAIGIGTGSLTACQSAGGQASQSQEAEKPREWAESDFYGSIWNVYQFKHKNSSVWSDMTGLTLTLKDDKTVEYVNGTKTYTGNWAWTDADKKLEIVINGGSPFSNSALPDRASETVEIEVEDTEGVGMRMRLTTPLEGGTSGAAAEAGTTMENAIAASYGQTLAFDDWDLTFSGSEYREELRGSDPTHTMKLTSGTVPYCIDAVVNYRGTDPTTEDNTISGKLYFDGGYNYDLRYVDSDVIVKSSVDPLSTVNITYYAEIPEGSKDQLKNPYIVFYAKAKMDSAEHKASKATYYKLVL